MSPAAVTALLLATQLMDAFSTLWVLGVPGVSVGAESNPLSRALLSAGPAQFLLIKALVALLASALILYGQRKRPRFAKVVLLLAVSIGILAVVNNVYSMSLLSIP